MNRNDRTKQCSGSISRRDFLKAGGAAMVMAGLAPLSQKARGAGEPAVVENLLLIVTDQQQLKTIAAGGCPYLKTPALDELMSRGVSFINSYSTNPVCSPARSSIFTGRMPSETGVYSNGKSIRSTIPNMGEWFSLNNYDTIYAGKWHVPAGSESNIPGFTVLTTMISGQGNIHDMCVSRACEGYLWNRSRTNPFLLVASFLQSHDICEWLRINNYDPGSLRYPELASELPPLPSNFNYDTNEPAKVKSSRNSDEPSTGNWTQEQWRYYLWCYYRHIEMVDAEIGRLLQALEDSGYADNTLIIFTSDHGEGMANHQMVRKSMLYEEGAQVPFIITWPGNIPQNQVDTTHLISGLDIMPTFCDYAGIAEPSATAGKSLRPLLEGGSGPWRSYVVSEVSSNTGRMVRTERYKYICYNGDSVEQLFDMQSDSAETANLATNPAYASILAEHRQMLKTWESRMDVDPHVPGTDAWWYQNYKDGDFDGDSDVDGADLAGFAGDWLGTETGSEKSDINNDGIVNLKDFTDFGKNWKK